MQERERESRRKHGELCVKLKMADRKKEAYFFLGQITGGPEDDNDGVVNKFTGARATGRGNLGRHFEEVDGAEWMQGE